MVYLPLNSEISDLCQKLWTEHSKQVTCHITKSSINQFQKTFEGAIFHCEDKQSSSLRIYTARASTTNPSNRHSKILPFSNQCPMTQLPLCHHLLRPSQKRHGKSYHWAVGNGRRLPSGYILAKRKKEFRSGRPIISFVDFPFRPMLNILARLIFQLIPVACRITLRQGMSTHS